MNIVRKKAIQSPCISDDMARRIVRSAIERGDLIRPDTCKWCGKNPGKARDGRSLIQAHHADYSKPLEIEFICVQCHRDVTPIKEYKGGTAVYGDRHGMRKHIYCRPFGSKNPHSKLKDEDVLAIFRSKDSQSKTAAKFGITKATVWGIRNGRGWSWLTGAPAYNGKKDG